MEGRSDVFARYLRIRKLKVRFFADFQGLVGRKRNIPINDRCFLTLLLDLRSILIVESVRN